MPTLKDHLLFFELSLLLQVYGDMHEHFWMGEKVDQPTQSQKNLMNPQKQKQQNRPSLAFNQYRKQAMEA